MNLRPSAPKACHSATVCLPGQTQVTNERKPPSCGVWKRSWPLPWQTINTLLVPSSSLFVALGVKAVRTEAGPVAPKLIGMGMACGLGFVGMKFLEYGEKFATGITPATNEFFLYFFALTGLHLFHVLLGLGVLTTLVLKSRIRQAEEMPFAFIEGGACLWHLVDLLWIILFPLLYLVR